MYTSHVLLFLLGSMNLQTCLHWDMSDIQAHAYDSTSTVPCKRCYRIQHGCLHHICSHQNIHPHR
uniref:Uncharacterized protein n=1 Tax=Arundo donax TaxID=35708 RepID=A0A0A9EWX1_ARUDO